MSVFLLLAWCTTVPAVAGERNLGGPTWSVVADGTVVLSVPLVAIDGFTRLACGHEDP